MHKIEIIKEGKRSEFETDGREFLQSALRKNGYKIYSPCGGKGTCGKCKVWVHGEGSVTSCIFHVTRDLLIHMPDERESQILVDQHQHTVEVPLKPGKCIRLSKNPHGVAIDIGTTSLVFYLVDLLSGTILETRAEENPQVNYGADVISRINYTAENSNGLKELQTVLIDSINRQLLHFNRFAEIAHEDIVKIAIAGNTTMLHLLLGVDPLPLALVPFTPRFIDRQHINTGDLPLYCHPEADIDTLPGISAYVGADIVAGLASIKPMKDIKTYLFMDIGTNGELALVTPERVLCCATAAGPAFEGARITHGMTAVEGALSAFSGSSFKVIGDVAPVGICGSGLIDIIASMLEEDLIDDNGLLESDFVVVDKEHSATGAPIMIYQQDVREVQLAKSAIAAGVKILMAKGGIDMQDLDAVFLAGGFGNYIDINSAIKIGLLSGQYKDKIIPMGNTSGTGALLSLKSSAFIHILNTLVKKAEFLELSEEPDFTMEFAMNMMFSEDLLR